MGDGKEMPFSINCKISLMVT